MKNEAKKLKILAQKKFEFSVLIDFYFHLLLHLTHSSENHLEKSVLENNGCPVDFNFENTVCPVDFNFENSGCPFDFNFENIGCPVDFNYKTGLIRLK
jgi:hypothetical protein